MLSVLIAADDPQILAQLITPLVPAAVDGLVREVVVSAGADPAVAMVAEDAGCILVSGEGRLGARMARAAAAGRAPWLLAPAGALPQDWRRRIEAALEARRGGRFAAGVADLMLARPRGLLVSRASYEAAGGFRDVEAAEADLARRLGGLSRL